MATSSLGQQVCRRAHQTCRHDPQMVIWSFQRGTRVPAAGNSSNCNLRLWLSSSSSVQLRVFLNRSFPLLQTRPADWTCSLAQSRIPCSGTPSKQETQLCLKELCLLEVRELAGYSASCYICTEMKAEASDALLQMRMGSQSMWAE